MIEGEAGVGIDARRWLDGDAGGRTALVAGVIRRDLLAVSSTG